ncbi:28S ribosomal protein S2, mitochondrial isoform X1 [Colletes gigas]|uniref:28S ribosomal protein S2, mitochondrial isoform X1 n=1 Tax=Colletes gigas TaxID=935657 RepID=UPI001C9A5E69|nr:28S ribosomal protein S2, mitochondrial isoform X1 [Colletes gigas]XP_043264430.1 28S ribosomal protein S2, mitochondrial isoform X1 [Colletes gigas]
MTSLATRTFSSKLWRDKSILRPYFAYLPWCKLSTGIKPQEEITNVPEDQESFIDPLTHPDFFKVHNLFTVKNLFDAKVHYGHMEGSLDDHMRRFVFGARMGHLIIDLDQTAALLRQALNFTAHIALRDGIILFICKSPKFAHLVETTAKECGEFAHTRRWKLGTFTNSVREFGLLTRLPDLCIFLNTMETVTKQHTAVIHAAKMAIPTIGIVDTNCNPNRITYPVPGNDDTPCAIELYCRLFKEAIMRGKKCKDLLS